MLQHRQIFGQLHLNGSRRHSIADLPNRVSSSSVTMGHDDQNTPAYSLASLMAASCFKHGTEYAVENNILKFWALQQLGERLNMPEEFNAV
ncbi:MAG: hypothetical protein ACYDBW_02885 [Sulfuricaulis sp.]